MERKEADETITLKQLKQLASGLDAELIYAIVPRQSIDDMIEARYGVGQAAFGHEPLAGEIPMSLFAEPEGVTELNAGDVAGLKFVHITTPKTSMDDVLSMPFVEELHQRLFGDVWE